MLHIGVHIQVVNKSCSTKQDDGSVSQSSVSQITADGLSASSSGTDVITRGHFRPGRRPVIRKSEQSGDTLRYNLCHGS